MTRTFLSILVLLVAIAPCATSASAQDGSGGQDAPRETAGDPEFPADAGVASDPNSVAPHLPDHAAEVANGTLWLPELASDAKAPKDVDGLFMFVMYICYFFAALNGFLIFYLPWKYRRREGVKPDQSHTHNTPLEILWSVIPGIVVIVIFWKGYVGYLDLRTPPAEGNQITVGARKWAWDFTYPNGATTTNEFSVPVGEPVTLLMSSTDVLHSFHLPSFRVKMDVVPNRFTKVWFRPNKVGTYRVYCAEYCGQDHSNMYSKLLVQEPEDHARWVAKKSRWWLDDEGEPLSPLDVGQLTYEKKGCSACHSVDGSQAGWTAPTFAGLWGRERTFADGSTRVADENYVRQSILDPHSELVEGYGPQMTVYSPMLNEQMIVGMIEYLKTLEDVPRQD